MTPEVFELDIPLVNGRPALSANQRLHWRRKAELTAMVRDGVAWRAKTARIGAQDHILVRLHFSPEDQRRRDASNLMPIQKAAVDGLVVAGVVPDDSGRWVSELMPKLHRPVGGARRMWLAVHPRLSLSAGDLAAIDEDVRAERAADAASGMEDL